MALVTTENTVTFSGLNKSLMDFYVDQHTNFSGGTLTVATGAGVLTGVISYVMSGAPPGTSSGGFVVVQDAISGNVFPTSGLGNGVLYYFHFGSQSGFATGGFPVLPPDLTGVNVVFKSGLVATGTGLGAGLAFDILFSKGV